MLTIDPERYRVKPGEPVSLERIPSRRGDRNEKSACRERVKRLQRQCLQLQEVLFAQSKYAVLFIIQSLDAIGKDSTVRRCFGPLNPQRCRVVGFKEPTPDELRHDFLWRIHAKIPPRGFIGIFNRSHYEDVLVGSVKGELDSPQAEKRLEHIRAFERLLFEEGTIIRKIFLHASKEYQKKRLQRRLRREDKRWKFSTKDLRERRYWDDYRRVYEDIFKKTSTGFAPWYVIPAENRWYRDGIVTTLLHQTLSSLDLSFPQPDFDPGEIEIA